MKCLNNFADDTGLLEATSGDTPFREGQFGQKSTKFAKENQVFIVQDLDFWQHGDLWTLRTMQELDIYMHILQPTTHFLSCVSCQKARGLIWVRQY